MVISLDLIADGGTDNRYGVDDGVHSGVVSGRGQKFVVEVFAQGVTVPLIGAKIVFDFDATILRLDKVENSVFAFAIPELTGVNFAATVPVTLSELGFLGRVEFFYGGRCYG